MACMACRLSGGPSGDVRNGMACFVWGVVGFVECAEALLELLEAELKFDCFVGEF